MRRSHETTAEIMDRMSEQLRPLAEAMQHDSGRPQGERSIAGMFLAMMGERSLRESTESRLRTAETALRDMIDLATRGLDLTPHDPIGWHGGMEGNIAACPVCRINKASEAVSS